MKKLLIFLTILLASIFASNEVYPQEKPSPQEEELNVLTMNKVDAYTTRWTYECAKKSNKIRTGLLCGVKFVRTVEKYDVKYKMILGMKKEKSAIKLVKKHLINIYMNAYYKGAIDSALAVHIGCRSKYNTDQDIEDCIKTNDAQEKMRKVYQKAKNKLKPLEIYSDNDLKEWKPRKINIVK